MPASVGCQASFAQKTLSTTLSPNPKISSSVRRPTSFWVKPTSFWMKTVFVQRTQWGRSMAFLVALPNPNSANSVLNFDLPVGRFRSADFEFSATGYDTSCQWSAPL